MDLELKLCLKDGLVSYEIRDLEGNLLVDPEKPDKVTPNIAIESIRLANSFVGMALNGHSLPKEK